LQPDTAARVRFNAAHIDTRVAIESEFGRWKKRWCILKYGMRLKPAKASKVVIACAVLHNFAIERNYGDFGDEDGQGGDEDGGDAGEGDGGAAAGIAGNGNARRDEIVTTHFTQ
jgi:hypothetical protein